MKLKVDDVELFYEVHGEGEPIVFAHGWLDDSSVWRSQVEFFAKKHSVIVYDHRGHGRSDKPGAGYSIQALSSDLYALLQKLELEKVVLVGHSMGGMVAMLFTLDHPDKVSRLVLVATTAKFAFLTGLFIEIFMRTRSYESFARGAIDFKYFKPSGRTVMEAIDRALRVPKHAAFKSFNAWSKEFDLRARISEIKLPALIIAGEKDRGIPLEMSQYLNRSIEGSELRVLPDCNHMVMIERADEFNEILEEFIG